MELYFTESNVIVALLFITFDKGKLHADVIFKMIDTWALASLLVVLN